MTSRATKDIAVMNDRRTQNRKNKSVIFGLGDSGLSVARFLHRQGEDFVLVDTRDIPPNIATINAEFPEHRKVFGNLDGFDLTSFSQIIISPGLARSEPIAQRAIESDIPVLGDIEIFYRNAKAPIIAITGSNGKSSVVTLVTEMLKEAGLSALCGGNIGIPALDLLTHSVPDYYVLEVSSFQLESIQDFSPNIAAILNLSPDHMDRYTSFSEYVATKFKIVEKATSIVLHHDELDVLANYNLVPTATFSGQRTSKADYKIIGEDRSLSLSVNGVASIETQTLSLRGTHNIENALAAMAITDLAGITLSAQATVLGNFSGLEHRTEFVGRWNDVTWINDSKGTNVGATVAALTGVFSAKEQGILIAGGVGKGADFSILRGAIAQHTPAVILFGQDASTIAAAIEGAAEVHLVADLEAAIRMANSTAEPGSTVLFSPACASFDMFTDYQQRGKIFKQLVNEVNSQ